MEKTKKLLSIFLSTVMLIGTMVCVDLSAFATSYIEFGSYPQAMVADSKLISNLNKQNLTWQSYRYYVGTGYFDGMKKSDCMEYADIVYNGIKYRSVKINNYRPSVSLQTSSNANSYQDENNFFSGNVYWFKYQPIKWRVLNSNTGLCLCENIIDAQEFSNTVYSSDGANWYNDSKHSNIANNYYTSSIRKWLINDFYDTAFSTDEKTKIDKRELDNSAFESTCSKFDSKNSFDKVFLLSYNDVNYNLSNGFTTWHPVADTNRRTTGTDYAKCQGLYVSNSHNTSSWSLRSAGNNCRKNCSVLNDGSISESCGSDVFSNSNGIRPAIYLVTTSNANSNPTNYSLKELTYKFGNSYSSFGYKEGYKIPYSSYKIVYGNSIHSYVMYKELQNEWGGSCYGISATSTMLAAGFNGLRPSSFNANAKSNYDLKVSDKNKTDFNLTQFIEAMHLTQFDAVVQYMMQYNTSLKVLVNIINSGPYMILIQGPQGGHAVIAYKYTIDSKNNIGKLHIYDPNFPNTNRFIKLTLDSQGKPTGWYYKLNDKYNWGTDYKGCKFSYLSYDTYSSIWNTGNLGSDWNVLFSNSNNYSIFDADGNIAAHFENGKLTQAAKDVFLVKNYSISSDKKNKNTMTSVVQLPSEKYTIVNNDKSINELEVTLSNEEHGTEIVTTSNKATINCDDDNSTCSVQINSNKSGETYNVKLISSVENEFDKFEVTGKIYSGSPTITFANEEYLLSNCKNVNIDIYGDKKNTTNQNIHLKNSNIKAKKSSNKNFDYDVSASSHSYSIIEKKTATSAKNGYIKYKCSDCGKIKKNTLYKASKISLSKGSYTYNGKVQKPSVTVKNSKGNKINSKHYTVAYAKGRKNVGKYTVTIKLKGNYSGTVKKTFTIKPKSTNISKLTPGKKKFTVKWKKLTTQTTGYQLQYSTSSNFKSAKTVTISSNKSTSKTISKLKAKKKYYVRIRTYKTVKINGKSTKIYSSWSKAKAVTTKK